MEITAKQRYALKKFIKEMSSYRGRHTELVSVYIPKGYDMNKIIHHLEEEKSTAMNIKSASTRKNVIDALERMIQHLKVYGRTPANGLAVFSGNVAEKEGTSDVRVWSIEPPIPFKIRIYRCDKMFVLEPLEAMLEEKAAYGLIVMDRRDANIALLRGKTIIPLVKTHSHVPGKFKAGGQSALRFARIIEGAAKEHYKKVAEYAKEQFLGKEGLKGIIVGGPGPTKYDFIEYLPTELKNKIIAIRDISYTGEYGLQELVDRSADVLAKEEIAEEKEAVGRFFETLAKKPEYAAYGEEEVMRALKIGAVMLLLLSESLPDKKIDLFEAEAKKVGTEVRIISTETREGIQLKDLGGIAAILRYAA